jgi:histidinol-phosphate aminotransferase
MSNIKNLIRPDLREFAPYSAAQDEAEIMEGSILLNANELPFNVKTREGVLVNRYPEKQPAQLIARLAEICHVQMNQLVLARGSDAMIDLLIRLFCRAEKDAILICPPTFGMYAVCAQLQGAQVIEVPLIKDSGYALDLPGILARWQPNVKLIFLCSPNNPTGHLLNTADIQHLCETYAGKSMIVVDEAYIEFSGQPGLSQFIHQYDNLVILRTLSKAYGLAAARCGFLLAQSELVQWLVRIMLPYPLSSIITQIIFDALAPEQLNRVKQQVVFINAERERLAEALSQLKCVKKVWPSMANFLLVEVDDVREIIEKCLQRKIILRDMQNKAGLENCLRISVGLPEENAQVIAAFG